MSKDSTLEQDRKGLRPEERFDVTIDRNIFTLQSAWPPRADSQIKCRFLVSFRLNKLNKESEMRLAASPAPVTETVSSPVLLL